MKNFWSQLKRPFFCLAPMEEVTDVVFREMFARYSGSRADSCQLKSDSNPFVLFTEFVNVDGLLHKDGFKKLKIDIEYTQKQRPIVAQLWGSDPEKFYRAAQLIKKFKFDGVDINMGCPQSREIKLNACAALIKNPTLAKEIIQATKEGAGGLPVSVKTRLGYSDINEMEKWISLILSSNIAVLTLHGRTKKEMSKVPAHWDKISEAVKIRDEMFKNSNERIAVSEKEKTETREKGIEKREKEIRDKGLEKRDKEKAEISDNRLFSNHTLSASPIGEASPPKGEINIVGERTLIIGNGDIKTYQEGLERAAQTGCDGVMVGRGAFGSPWFFNSQMNHNIQQTNNQKQQVQDAVLFNSVKNGLKPLPTLQNRLKIMLEHAELFNEKLGGIKSFYLMRKHFKAYVHNFEGAANLRAKLLQTKNLQEVKEILKNFEI